MIEYINEKWKSIGSPDDLPITDVNVVTFLIKVKMEGGCHVVLLSFTPRVNPEYNQSDRF